MFCPFLLCQDVGNDHFSTDSGCDNHSCINFSFYLALNQVDSGSDLIDKMTLIVVDTQPTKKTKECRPIQIDTEEKWKQKEITPRKQGI